MKKRVFYNKLCIYFIKALKKIKILWRFNFCLTTTFNNVKIKIPFINGIGLTNFVFESGWMDSLIKLFACENNNTFIDVGINVGQTLIRLKTLKPTAKYLGFEPNSTCIAYTHKLIELNGFTDCIIQNCALSNKVQILVLEKRSAVDSSASIVPSMRPGYFTKKEDILAVDYDSFYSKYEISFIKIDVEGGELEVLKGMERTIKKYQPLIMCEVLDSYDDSTLILTQDRASAVSTFLHNINYLIIQLETNRSTHKLVQYKKIESIIVDIWTTQSYEFNDYMFYPLNREKEVFKILNNIVHN